MVTRGTLDAVRVVTDALEPTTQTHVAALGTAADERWHHGGFVPYPLEGVEV